MESSLDENKLNIQTSKEFVDPLHCNQKEWVKFEEEKINTEELPPIKQSILKEDTINKQPQLNREILSHSNNDSPAVIDIPSDNIKISQLTTVELPRQRNEQEGFANGDIIVTLLPVNESCAWLTPAIFKPHFVPEELMCTNLTLSIEEYVEAIELLVHDFRFTLYNACYKRILLLWITIAFFVLLGLLFSGITGILLFSLGVSWLFLNAASIFMCVWLKSFIQRGLEKCLANVNKSFLKHNIVLILDDRGNISCHKVHLCFLYFDSSECISYINNYLETRELNSQRIEPGWESTLEDIVIQGKNSTRIPRKHNRGEQIILRYISRYGKDRIRGYLKVSGNQAARHFCENLCPCQYIENHLNCKPQDNCSCWPASHNENHLYPYQL